ncbi:hypothetical protein GCM10010123_20520 [Pilimelia anulata]|uniref:Uncharacterized protein n=1 Tax=Pilimelia anulata TaxID=53371 RepID=A0A8J3B5Y2_9ACTN|nr:hypothetical protein GCM10010123_20520 [Pilimelia anulata]
MRGVASYLSGAETGLEHYLSVQEDMDSYYAAEFGDAWESSG